MNTLSCADSEKAILGCIAGSEGAALDQIEIDPELFFVVGHRLVAEAMLRLFSKNAPVNFLSVTKELSSEDLAKVGGQNGVFEACSNVCPVSGADYFLRILREKQTLRKIHGLAVWAQNQVKVTTDVPAFCAELQAKASFVETGEKSENVLQQTIRNVSQRLDAIEEGRVTLGREVPLQAWNALFGGLVEGQLYALAGRPGTGKTSLMEQFIANLVSHNVPVLVFEKDMSPEMLIERMACRTTGVPYWKYIQRKVNKDHIRVLRTALDCFSRAPLHLYSPTGLTAEKLCAIVRREKRLSGIQAVFLDHMQVLNVGDDLREGLTRASIAIRTSATETGIPHVVLAQLNRKGADGRPRPEDIKEFDQLYADCDCMAMLWSQKKPEDIPPGEKLPVNLYAAKNRNGPVAEEPLLFDGGVMKFDYESPAIQPEAEAEKVSIAPPKRRRSGGRAWKGY